MTIQGNSEQGTGNGETVPAAATTASPSRLKTGVFGGTFDPPHLGHLIIATELQHALGLDRVLFIPAGDPPHKAYQHVSAPADRLAMLRLAIAETPAFDVSTIEIDRTGPSYTVETLQFLTAEMPDARLIFLMGEDSLRDLSTWREPDRIATLAELAVATRPGVTVDLETVYSAIPETRGRVRLVDVPEIGIASRDLRRRASEGLPIRYQVLPAVDDYIREHRLYCPERTDRSARSERPEVQTQATSPR
jgi:nicotinate-nucleotide adenylyltransferase